MQWETGCKATLSPKFIWKSPFGYFDLRLHFPLNSYENFFPNVFVYIKPHSPYKYSWGVKTSMRKSSIQTSNSENLHTNILVYIKAHSHLEFVWKPSSECFVLMPHSPLNSLTNEDLITFDKIASLQTDWNKVKWKNNQKKERKWKKK